MRKASRLDAWTWDQRFHFGSLGRNRAEHHGDHHKKTDGRGGSLRVDQELNHAEESLAKAIEFLISEGHGATAFGYTLRQVNAFIGYISERRKMESKAING